MVVLGGGAVSYERGTPVSIVLQVRASTEADLPAGARALVEVMVMHDPGYLHLFFTLKPRVE